jgi:hypothetical protein
MIEIDYSKNVGKIFRGKEGTVQRDANYKVLSFLPNYGVGENRNPSYRFAKLNGGSHGAHSIRSCEDFHTHFEVLPDGHLVEATEATASPAIQAEPESPSPTLPASGG